jgi:hypothetical protein
VADSLQYGGLELLSGAGGIYHIADGQRGLGDPQAVVASVRAQLTMGSAVVGRFTDNRHVSLSVVVTAANRTSLSAACEALAYQVNQPVNTLVWKPSGGLPTVFDTWRGQVAASWSAKFEAADARVMQITFDALPFGRSDTRTVISGSSGSVALADFSTPTGFTYKTVSSTDGTLYPDLLNNDATKVASVPMPITGTNHAAITASPAPIDGTTGSTQVDANWYESAASYTYTTTTLSSGQSAGGTTTTTVPAQGTAAIAISPASGGPWNISATPNVSAAIYSGTYGTQSVYLKLTDSHAVTQTFPMTLKSATEASGQWDYFAVNVAGSTIDLANVTAWSLIVAVGRYSGYTTGLASTPVILGRLKGYPVSSSQVTTLTGTVLKLASVPGSARADASIQIDRGGTNTLSGFMVYRSPADAASTAPVIVPMSGSPTTGTAQTPALLAGTYRVIAAGSGFNLSGTAITITQKVNGVSVGTKSVNGPSGTVKWADLGEVTFPFADVPAQATGLSYTFASASAIAGLTEMLLLDTRGFLVWVPALTSALKYVWIDEATALNGYGGVYAGNASDRSDAISQLGVSGVALAGAFSVDPGDNYLMAYCPDGIPNVTASFYPRWLHERSA